MAPKTRTEHNADMKYILEVILRLDDDPTEPIHSAIAKKKIFLVQDFISLSYDKYSALEYDFTEDDGTKTTETLPSFKYYRLHGFKHFVSYLEYLNKPVVGDDWQSGIDVDEF